ncbi:uncharacterized protein V6R79_017339 [Siganus canaliculatus]
MTLKQPPVIYNSKQDDGERPLVIVEHGSRSVWSFQDHMFAINSTAAERKILPLFKPLCDGPPLSVVGTAMYSSTRTSQIAETTSDTITDTVEDPMRKLFAIVRKESPVDRNLEKKA